MFSPQNGRIKSWPFMRVQLVDWAWACLCLSISSVVWNLSHCLWLLWLGSSHVAFVVKCEQGEYGHRLTLARLRQMDETGLFFVVENKKGHNGRSWLIQCSGCAPLADCETRRLVSNSLAWKEGWHKQRRRVQWNMLFSNKTVNRGRTRYILHDMLSMQPFFSFV